MAGALKNDILLGVTTDPSTTADSAALFEKYFGSKVCVIRMAHQGPFGMRVQVAVKADPAGYFTKPVYFYSYDKKANIPLPTLPTMWTKTRTCTSTRKQPGITSSAKGRWQQSK